MFVLHRFQLEPSLHLPIMGRSTVKMQAMQIGQAARGERRFRQDDPPLRVDRIDLGSERRTNNYRDYDARDVHELRFIRSARDLGLSLDDIRPCFGLWRTRSRMSADVRALASRHLDDIERRSGTCRGGRERCATSSRPATATRAPTAPSSKVSATAGDSPCRGSTASAAASRPLPSRPVRRRARGPRC